MYGNSDVVERRRMRESVRRVVGGSRRRVHGWHNRGEGKIKREWKVVASRVR